MSERHRPLAIDAAEFRRIGRRLVDAVADHLESLPSRPVTRGDSPAEIRRLLDADAPLPAEGRDAGALLETAARLLFDHSLFNGHPKFFGYITAPPSHIGILGDLLAAAVNANTGSFILAPVATEIECQTIRWIAELIGFPTQCGGVLVSGGNMANFIGFFAARAAKAGGDVRADGVTGSGRRRVYCSAETHTWIQKAADLSGLGTGAIRWIEADASQRMKVEALERALDEDARQGDVPFMVVGTGGSVSTGAVDPLVDIARVCRERDLWFHIDGAYGGFAAAVPGASPDLEAGIPLADSVAVDPHKWLYAPLEAGCALVKNLDHLRGAFAYHPPYYHFGVEATNFVDHGPQNSRGFRALKVWLALAHAGRAGYVASIGDDIRLAARLHERVSSHPLLEPCTNELSISTFRFVPADRRAGVGDADVEAYLNQLNAAILDRIQREGQAFVSNAVIGGRYVLRACIVNFNTRETDVDALPGIVARLGQTIDAEMRA
ncbi:MAG TPA: aminotransferase class V-fold PLP-dependent enzyme [Vicinamibacterales bacterium]|nr:aminotransferase class V-fold PLP-dependent enzyme [Vicinamibacterales bacterium]